LEVFATERAEFDVVDLPLIWRKPAKRRLAFLGDVERNPAPVGAVFSTSPSVCNLGAEGAARSCADDTTQTEVADRAPDSMPHRTDR